MYLLIIVSQATGETTRELHACQQMAIARVAELESCGHIVTTKGPRGYRI